MGSDQTATRASVLYGGGLFMPNEIISALILGFATIIGAILGGFTFFFLSHANKSGQKKLLNQKGVVIKNHPKLKVRQKLWKENQRLIFI